MSKRSLLSTQRLLSLGHKPRAPRQRLAGLTQLLNRLFLVPDAWAANLLGFLAGRACIIDAANPFGVALFFIVLQAGNRIRSLSVAIAVLTGMSTVSEPTRVLSIAIAMTAAYIYQYTQENPEETPAWSGALAAAGLLAIARLGEAFVVGITTRGVSTIFLEAVMALLATLLFAPLVHLVREGMPYRLHPEQLVSVGLAAVVVGTGLGGLHIGPIQLAEIWNRWVTLVAALLGHGAIGAAQGTALGIMTEISSAGLVGGGAGLYGISGLIGGLFSQGRRPGVIAGFFLGNLIASVQASTGDSIAMGLLHTAVAALLFAFTPDALIYRLARAIPGTSAQVELAAGREERLKAAVTERMAQLADVFQEMATVFADVDQTVSIAGAGAALQQRLQESREIVPRQLRGLSDIMASAAGQIRLDTGKGDEIAARVGEELAKRRVHYSNLHVFHAGGNHPEVSFAIDTPCSGDGRCSKVAAQAVTAALVETYTPWQTTCGGRNGGCFIRLLPEKPLDVKVGQRTLAKDDSLVSGDSYAKTELANGKVVILLSDGMGAGPQAARESQAAVAMLQRLINTGFDPEFAVQTVNSVLMLRSPEETYATVDLVVVDLFTGELEFLKIGSAPSFIKRGRDVEIVRSASLPVGIVDDVQVASRKRLLRPGDLLVMVTDGVIDGLPNCLNKEERFASYMRRMVNEDAQDLADALLDLIAGMVPQANRDDMAVVVVKLVRRISNPVGDGDLPVFHRATG